MDREALACYLALESCPGIGPIGYRQQIERDDVDIPDLFKLGQTTLAQLGFSPNQVQYLRNPDWASIEQALNWCDEADDHRILTLADPNYPKLLTQINDPPPVLYTVGDIALLDSPQIAIVGSRHCTPGGAATAADFARVLAQSGLTITSGMALGIDGHAHQAALDASRPTIAVTATGIDRIYPARHRHLAHAIAEHGLIVTEFPLGTTPLSRNFPKRNRIISGLSLAVLVVEAALNSGSLITARLGLEQGREVFAIPGSIHNPHARGCHKLIRDGAKLVDQAADIIEDIASLLGYVAEQADGETTNSSEITATSDPEYQALLSAMGYDPVSVDTLVERSGLTVEQLSSMLLILELNEQIKTAPGGLYIRC